MRLNYLTREGPVAVAAGRALEVQGARVRARRGEGPRDHCELGQGQERPEPSASVSRTQFFMTRSFSSGFGYFLKHALLVTGITLDGFYQIREWLVVWEKEEWTRREIGRASCRERV